MFRSYATVCCSPAGLQESITLALSSGMYGISVDMQFLEGLTKDKSQACQAFADAGLSVTDLGLYDTITRVDTETLPDLQMAVKAVSEIGGGALRMRLEEPVQLPALQQLCAVAGEAGTEIWLETAGAYGESKALRQLLDTAGLPNLKAVWDVLHTVLGGEPIADTAANLKGVLAHVCVKDGLVTGADCMPAAYGTGILPTEALLALLREMNYGGFICLDREPGWKYSPEVYADDLELLLEGRRWLDRCDVKAALANVPLPPLYPPEEHPRVMFRKQDIPRIRICMAAPENANAMERYRAALRPDAEIFLPPDVKQEVERMTPEEVARIQNRDRGMGAADAKYQHIRADILDNIEIRAFAYAVDGDEAIGRSAVEAMFVYLENCVALVYDDLGQLVYTAAEIYDWCFPLLTQAQREELIDRTLGVVRRMEIGWPPVQQGALTGHGVESQLFRDLFALGIATYGERPEIYDVAAGLLIWEFIPARRFFNTAHMNIQGGQYTIYRAHWELLSAALLRGMGAPNLFGPSQGHLLDWLLWARQPDGYSLIDGDNSTHNLPPVDYYEQGDRAVSYYTDELDWLTYGRRPAGDTGRSDLFYDTSAKRCYTLAASLYQNPYYKEEALRCMPDFRLPEPYRNRTINTVEFLLINDPFLKPAPSAQLPRMQYFPFPKGGVLVRTGWNVGRECGDVLCEMKINEYWGTNHQHQDAGAFQLYYKGMLATDSGYYQSKLVFFDFAKRETMNVGDTGYGSRHDYNYNKSTISHNCMLVVDPDETNATAKPMGGQPFLSSYHMTLHSFISARVNRVGQVLGVHSEQGCTYLSGEISRAYGPKVTGYTRSFAFVEFEGGACPAALIVYDDITSADRTFRKYWLCHGVNPPQTEGSRSTFSVTERGYNGRLTVDTLLPREENLEVSAITDPADFDVFGTKYPAELFENRRNSNGACRIMVSPKTEQERDQFLHVLQVSDADGPDMVKPLYVEAEGLCGAVVYDAAVLFIQPDTRSFAVTLPVGCRRVFLCGIDGSWKINDCAYTVQPGVGMLSVSDIRMLLGEKEN